jgi:hypothetical protein
MKTYLVSEELLRQVLDLLEQFRSELSWYQPCGPEQALRALLSKEPSEPVAWRTIYMHEGNPQICLMVHPPHPHSDMAKRPHQTDALYLCSEKAK